VSEIERIIELLRSAYNGDAWYGSSLKSILSDITADQAFTKTIKQSHSIAEILLHITAWQGAVRKRLEESYVELPDEGDWPEISDDSESSWQAILAKLDQSHFHLENAIAKLNDEMLSIPLGSERVRETGSGVSIYITLHGIIQHLVYHSGQISLIKRAFQ
jgi:uncharacterized damage-inducible protein DinB